MDPAKRQAMLDKVAARRAQNEQQETHKVRKLALCVIGVSFLIVCLVDFLGPARGFDAVADGMSEAAVVTTYRKPERFAPEYGPKNCDDPNAWAWDYSTQTEIVQLCRGIVVGKLKLPFSTSPRRR